MSRPSALGEEQAGLVAGLVVEDATEHDIERRPHGVERVHGDVAVDLQQDAISVLLGLALGRGVEHVAEAEAVEHGARVLEAEHRAEVVVIHVETVEAPSGDVGLAPGHAVRIDGRATASGCCAPCPPACGESG